MNCWVATMVIRPPPDRGAVCASDPVRADPARLVARAALPTL
jgi:hypothetical protein